MTTTSSQREFVATYYTAYACTVEVGASDLAALTDYPMDF